MIRFHSLVRPIALVLLLLAAGDLLIGGACEDGAILTTTASAFSQNDDGDGAGHTGEDCYCCSRTVRAEVQQGLLPIVEVVGQREDVVRRLPQSPSRVLYHPPLA